MIIYSFTNDYSEGCHPNILQKLTESNTDQEAGYGEGQYSVSAIQKIRLAIENPEVAVYFVAGGTLTNLIVLSAILKPFESIISTSIGHIHTHEAGAIEAVGHKIETVDTLAGKLCPKDIAPLLDKFPLYHTTRPKVVYISNPTEIGTIYTKGELTELSDYCRDKELLLYLDGARLPSALVARSNDLTLADIARLSDVFYIGGTKSGALLGEALVITNESLKEDFAYHLKQRGGILAKGRLLGIQFDTLFENNLLFDLAIHANEMAVILKEAFEKLGFSFLTDTDTNQLFPILPNGLIEQLSQEYDFYPWLEIDQEYTVIRLITSWATPVEKVNGCINRLKELV